MTRRLIETWLPIAELGIESLRERTPMTPFPAPNRLHVWWARRPLVASRAAVLASLLPEDADPEKFLHALGIHGDPVASRKRIDAARRKGERFEGQAYSYPRAFSYKPSLEEEHWVKNQAAKIGIENPVVVDPTAGGGSIPFEAVRLGANSFANDLNPVAALVLKATIQYPLRHGYSVAQHFKTLADEFAERREKLLLLDFPPESSPDAVSTNFIWAHTITCPYCTGRVPLSPNWRLAPDGTGVRLLPDEATRRCGFEIVGTVHEQSEGTVKGGDATCPFPDCGRVIDGDEVKRQAQSGGMGEQLFCVVYKQQQQVVTKSGRTRKKWVRHYRPPRPQDDNSATIRQRLDEKLPQWQAWDMIPNEEFPVDTNDTRPIQYGMPLWRDLFNPRQLLCHGTSVEVFRELLREHEEAGTLDEVTKAAFVYLSFSLDKLRDYNSRMTRWHSNRQVMVNTFDRHDFAFKWSYAEMAPLITGLGYDWALEQTGKCIKELVALVGVESGAPDLFSAHAAQDQSRARVTVTCVSGDDLSHLESGSVDAVVMDPPYYDNVMYAELSDFFYVWLKRTAGHVVPELFSRRLTDKENEAVANPARHAGERGAKALAGRDYQERMARIFAECRRLLKDDGILTLMFTHKATGAWDALTQGLLESGFTITASWPINTEAEGSLHIKDKAAANSTIFLICRPRPQAAPDKHDYWEEVEPLVKQAVRQKVDAFQQAGIRGVDLYLSCFGPALEEFARHWPLRRGNPKENPATRRRQQSLLAEAFDPYAVTPEDALEAARREVKQWRLEQLLRTQRQAELDPHTEWFVLAWDTFRAPQFPYDEALRLARVVGVDLDRDIVGRLAEKKTSTLILCDSSKRAAKGALGPADGSRSLLDTLHHAAHRARSLTLEAARELLDQSGAPAQPGFENALQAVLEVLPVSSTFTHVADESGPIADAASDFEVLENLRRLAFSAQVPQPEQLKLWL